MAFIPIPGCASAVIRGTYFDNPLIHVLHFTKGGGGNFTAGDCTLLANTIVVAWPAAMLANFSNSYTFDDVKVTDQSSVSGPSVTVAPASPQVGGITNPGLPGSVAVVLTHRTAARGRSFRGRTYIGAITEQHVDGNQVVGQHLINLLEDWSQFLEDVEVENFTFVIASRYTGNAPRTTGIFTPVISSAFRDGNVDSQRRRSQN